MDNLDRLYVVFDKLSEIAGPVFQQPTDAAAIRSFRQFMLKVPPVDHNSFQLIKVGSFDPKTCKIFPPAETEDLTPGIEELLRDAEQRMQFNTPELPIPALEKETK